MRCRPSSRTSASERNAWPPSGTRRYPNSPQPARLWRGNRLPVFHQQEGYRRAVLSPSVSSLLLSTICHLFPSSSWNESEVKPVSWSRYTPSRRNPSEMLHFKVSASLTDMAETAIAAVATNSISTMAILTEPVFMSAYFALVERHVVEHVAGILCVDFAHPRSLSHRRRKAESCGLRWPSLCRGPIRKC